MWLILLSGCLSYADGQARVGELNCQLADTCDELAIYGYDDVQACIDHADAEPYDDDACPDYDAGQMHDCIDAWETAVEAGDCAFVPGDTCRVCG